MAQHAQAQGGVVAGLVEGALEEREDVVVAVHHAAGEEHVGAHPVGPLGEARRAGGEEVGQALLLPGHLQQLGQQHHPSGVGVAGRGEAQRVPGQVGGQPDRAARGRARDRPVEPGREHRVGLGGGEGEVQHPALVVGDHGGEVGVETSYVVGGRGAPGDLGQQRVRRPDPLPVQADDTGGGRVLQHVRSGELAHLRGAQVGVERQREQQPAGGRVEVGDAEAEEVLDRVGDGQLVADRRRVPTRQEPADLEGEERVAQRRVVDPPEQVVGEPQAEPGREDLPRAAEGRRPHHEPVDPVVAERALHPAAGAGATGEEDGHPVLQPARRVGERGQRRPVEPLQVVDGHEEVPLAGQGAQGREERERDHLLGGRLLAGLGPVERHLQRVQLRRGDRRELVHRDLVEQVDQPREGESRLGRAAPRRQHPHPAVPAPGQALLPQAGLADARLALEHQRPHRGRLAVEHLGDQLELGVARDETHVGMMTADGPWGIG